MSHEGRDGDVKKGHRGGGPKDMEMEPVTPPNCRKRGQEDFSSALKEQSRETKQTVSSSKARFKIAEQLC